MNSSYFVHIYFRDVGLFQLLPQPIDQQSLIHFDGPLKWSREKTMY